MKKLQRVLLSNRNNMQVELVDFGARINAIRVPNKRDQLIEVTLSDQRDSDVLKDAAFKGATCGRVANRIGNASFTCNGICYPLLANEGNHILHGGNGGFSQRFWQIQNHTKHFHADAVTFELRSENLDQGFPGNVIAQVRYCLTHDNTLNIHFSASSDKLSPMNMCNHTYFHLGESDIQDLNLQVFATRYLEIDADSIPTGQCPDVNNLVNLQRPTKLGDFLPKRPLDHCYILNKAAPTAAILRSKKQGLQLNIKSNQTGMQVYTGAHLSAPFTAIALEAQGLPDAVNHPNFECDWVSPERPYTRYVAYQFLSY
jgi:aldose 1-epimerase